METQIIDGNKIKKNILSNIKDQILNLDFIPVFSDILIGNDEVSLQYVKMKEKIALSVGIKFKRVQFDENITTEEVLEEINNLNNVPHMCGIILQLPIPGHINKNLLLDAINRDLDVDCLGSINSNNFYNNINSSIKYPTAIACINILKSINVDLSNLKIVVLGNGTLVGKPVAHLLKLEKLDVITIDSKTDNKLELIKRSDVVISAIGSANYLKGYMIKKGAIIIDAGTSEDNGAVYGDVELDSVLGVASYISKTPGGVGPVTVAMLLSNVLQVAKNKIKK